MKKYFVKYMPSEFLSKNGFCFIKTKEGFTEMMIYEDAKTIKDVELFGARLYLCTRINIFEGDEIIYLGDWFDGFDKFSKHISNFDVDVLPDEWCMIVGDLTDVEKDINLNEEFDEHEVIPKHTHLNDGVIKYFYSENSIYPLYYIIKK